MLNNSKSNYTIIIPTDGAVDKLPKKFLDKLQDKRQMEALLMYHIVPGTFNISKLNDEDTIPTVSGQDIIVNKYRSNRVEFVTMSGSPIVAESRADYGNLKLYAVDRVMYPPQGNLYEIITKSPILKYLQSLINVANLQTELSVSGPFTLFAPSDDAFKKLSLESIGYLFHDAESSRGEHFMTSYQSD